MENNKYKVAKYMRLSRDDGDDKESESIENQRDIINNYINEHEELEEIKEYVDDGYTGTNFNRPGFKEMLEDIKNEKINCIITKDLSRFGRDHIETGYYLERYFPSNSIRYIAIGDNVDTLRTDGLQFLTFKLSFNDYYAQDISNKIRSVKKRKIEKGEFQGGIAPYGYKKDENIKNHLIIDEYAAEIIKNIFYMYVNKGMSASEIADELNRREIKSPALYLKIPTYIKRESCNSNGKYLWLRTQIGKILKNEVYIGSVVGRKFQKVSHKIAKVRTTKPEEYIIVKNMHEPIIDLITWKKAQEKLQNKHGSRTRKFDHPLKGLIFCKECGGIATLRCRIEERKSGTEWRANYFICSNRNYSKQKCDCKQIRTDYLEEQIKEQIKNESKNITYSEEELKEIYKESQRKNIEKINKLEKDLINNKKKLKKINKTIEEIYLDKINNIIEKEDFKMIYNEKLDERKKVLIDKEKIENNKEEIKKKIENMDINKINRIIKETLKFDCISKEIYKMLIEKIEFDKNKNIYVKFKFSKYNI